MEPVTFYKCLADKTRLSILLLITREAELCVCELTTALNEIQPKVSRHLAQLRDCGLLSDFRQGQWVFYRLSETLDSWAISVLRQTLSHNTPFIADKLKHLNQMGDRPVRKAQCCQTD